jgi:hypothetical protein
VSISPSMVSRSFIFYFSSDVQVHSLGTKAQSRTQSPREREREREREADLHGFHRAGEVLVRDGWILAVHKRTNTFNQTPNICQVQKDVVLSPEWVVSREPDRHLCHTAA